MTKTKMRPAEIDIQCGRGGGSNNHLGNILFLRVVHHNKGVYKRIKRSEHKRFLAESIIQALQARGAQFVQQDRKDGTWKEIPHDRAVTKVLQALREREHNRDRIPAATLEISSRGGLTGTIIESGVVVQDDPPTSLGDAGHSAFQNDQSDQVADCVISGTVVSDEDSSTSSSDMSPSIRQVYESNALADALHDDYFDDSLSLFDREDMYHVYDWANNE
jgi:hypothetical protein